MAKKLDHNRPFGTIWGAQDGRRYVQDGVTFDVRGEPWVDPKALKTSMSLRPPTAEVAEPVDPEKKYTGAELNAMKLPQLQAIGKKYGLTGKRRVELIKRIIAVQLGVE